MNRIKGGTENTDKGNSDMVLSIFRVFDDSWGLS